MAKPSPSPAVEVSCSALRCSGVGQVGAEGADRRWKENAPNPEPAPRLAPGGDTAGRRGLWTGQRLRSISRELAQLGLRVSPNTVRRLLGEP
ncbi:MAG TPA: hypothetical protein VK639_09285, partial [Terriglobales bacterium]|nr:hypothetical protein [Terriglobales bacterium]